MTEIRHPFPSLRIVTAAFTGLRQWGLLGDNWGKKSTSFKFWPPQSFYPPLQPPPSSPSQHRPGTFTPDIDLYFKTTTEPHVPSLSWHKRFVEMGSDIADNWQSPAPRPPPPFSFPTPYLNWQAVFLFAMQSRVLLCAFLVFEHMTKHMCHTQADRNVFFHQHTKKKKKHGDALIEVRVNSLTWYSNSFNIYRTFSPHEMAAVVFFFFFNFERNWYQLCVCVYDDGCIHCCSWSTLIYMHVNGLEYECHCSTSTAIFVAYFFFSNL